MMQIYLIGGILVVGCVLFSVLDSESTFGGFVTMSVKKQMSKQAKQILNAIVFTFSGIVGVVVAGTVLYLRPLSAITTGGANLGMCVQTTQTVFNEAIAAIVRYGSIPLGALVVTGFSFTRSIMKRDKENRAAALTIKGK